jgi:hypothetical protein
MDCCDTHDMHHAEIPKPLRKQLEALVDGYEAIPGFPLGRCRVSQDISLRTSTHVVRGLWKGPMRGMYGRALKEAELPVPQAEIHFFNYDPISKTYFDVTARQFDQDLPRILVFTENDPRITTIGKHPHPEELVKVQRIDPAVTTPFRIQEIGAELYVW